MTSRSWVLMALRGATAIAAACALLACPRSVPKAPREVDHAVKAAVPNASLARLYVYRLRAHALFRYTNSIAVGPQRLGVIAQGRYVVADLPPGRHVVTATTNADPGVGVTGSSSLSLELLAGRIYFVRVEVPFWNIERPTIKQVEGLEGWKSVQKCRLAR